MINFLNDYELYVLNTNILVAALHSSRKDIKEPELLSLEKLVSVQKLPFSIPSKHNLLIKISKYDSIKQYYLKVLNGKKI